MKTESVAEFLKRGGQIKKVKYKAPENILTAVPSEKEEPASYEMDCDPNVITVPVKPDLILDSEVDNDIEDESIQLQEATETSVGQSYPHLPKGRQDCKS